MNAADALIAARRSGQPVPAVVPADAAAAYAAQAAVAQAMGWFGEGLARHWKSGGPSRTALQTHAPLPPAGVWVSPARAGAWPLRLRGIEAELALRLDQDVDAAAAATLDAAGAGALIDAVCVSIEIVESRWIEGLDAPPLAKLADLQSHAALVLGAWQRFVPRDWSRQACSVTIGGAAPQRFTGTHSMGDPAWVLPGWLRHATAGGATVPAGTIVTTGTWCGLLAAAEGDRVHVTFAGIGEAEVEV